jgi:hypothetical protein
MEACLVVSLKRLTDFMGELVGYKIATFTALNGLFVQYYSL